MTRSDGRDRHSRTRLLLDGFDRALAAHETEPLRAWMNLAVLWGMVNPREIVK